MATRLRRWWVAGAAAGLLALTLAPLANAKTANTPQPPFQIGRFWCNPEYDGAEGWSGSFFQYPGGIPNTDVSASRLKRGWVGQGQKGGTYLQVTDWTDPTSVLHEFAGSYLFRSMNYDYPREYLGPPAGPDKWNYLYPGGVQEIFRWARPTITVVAKNPASLDTTITVRFFSLPTDTLAANRYDDSGAKWRPAPVVDPNLVTEETIYMWWRYIPGVEYHRTMYAYPYGSAHQDYNLMDITLVNNGLSGNTNNPPKVLNQTVHNMIWAQAFDYRGQTPIVRENGRDNEAMYVQPWGTMRHAAALNYDTDDEDASSPGADWGDPAEATVYENHLLGNAYSLFGAVFTSKGPGANYAADDTAQPAYRLFWNERALDYAAKTYSPASITEQREFLVGGDLQKPFGEKLADNPLTSGIRNEDPGATTIMGYGPLNAEMTNANIKLQGWTLGWLDSVHIVQVLAGGGIDQEEGRRIGKLWNERKAAGAPANTWMGAADIALVKTGQDTVMKAAALAYWNYWGTFAPNVDAAKLAAWHLTGYATSKAAAYNQPYNVPEAPRPPGAIIVRPRTQGGIEVRWTRESESAVDFDTKTADFKGYRVWRQSLTRAAKWELAKQGLPGDFTVVAADGNVPAGLAFIDNDPAKIVPGQNYWYAVTAYDDGTQNWAQTGRSLESARWWTWTGYELLGVTAPQPEAIAESGGPTAYALEQNVPNPFNPNTTITFAMPQTGKAKLVIYSANGQVVRTLTDGTVAAGRHEIMWNGTDQMGRAVSSGVYVYRLTSDNGTISKRMVLVR